MEWIRVHLVADLWGIRASPNIPFETAVSGPEQGYYPAMKKAPLLCGSDAHLIFIIIRKEDGQEVFIFSRGSCASGGDVAIGVTYNTVSGTIGNPELYTLLAHSFKPIPITNWKISSRQAFNIALANGGQENAFQEMFLDVINKVPAWSVLFKDGRWPKYIRLKAQTGEILDLSVYAVGI